MTKHIRQATTDLRVGGVVYSDEQTIIITSIEHLRDVDEIRCHGTDIVSCEPVMLTYVWRSPLALVDVAADRDIPLGTVRCRRCAGACVITDYERGVHWQRACPDCDGLGVLPDPALEDLDADMRMQALKEGW